MNMSKQAKPRNVATLLTRAKLEYLSSIVFHIVLVAKKYVSRTVWNTIDDRYSIWRTKLEYLSAIVFHCPSGKRICQNKEMWLNWLIEQYWGIYHR